MDGDKYSSQIGRLEVVETGRDAYHRCSRRRDAVLRMLSRAHRRRAAEADAECINIVSRSPPALQTTGARYPGTRQA